MGSNSQRLEVVPLRDCPQEGNLRTTDRICSNQELPLRAYDHRIPHRCLAALDLSPARRRVEGSRRCTAEPSGCDSGRYRSFRQRCLGNVGRAGMAGEWISLPDQAMGGANQSLRGVIRKAGPPVVRRQELSGSATNRRVPGKAGLPLHPTIRQPWSDQGDRGLHSSKPERLTGKPVGCVPNSAPGQLRVDRHQGFARLA